jgi:flagellin-like hook-associated protein FlgL
MFRPGRFTLRALALTAVSFAVLAPASFAQAVSLDGESFESTLGVPGQETTFNSFVCNKSGSTTVSFTTQGSAFGPYSGTFMESGSFTIGPQTDTSIDVRGVGPITAFQATFTINSQFPAGTVTGTKQLAPTAPSSPSLAVFGSCDPDGSSPPNDVIAAISDPHLLYSAQINATTGSGTDSGTSGLIVQSVPTPPSLITFQEGFNSTACEDGNNGQGQGQGSGPKKNDNDDDEFCP